MRYSFDKRLVDAIGVTFSRILSSRAVSGSVLIALLFCGMTSFTVQPSNHYSSSRPIVVDGPKDSDSLSPQPTLTTARPLAQQAQRVQAEVIAIRRTGIEPTSIVRPRGRFILAVYNRSGLSEVELKLDRVGGNTLRLARVSREKLDWRSLEDLPPGEYTLSETKHPGWRCSIKITP